MPSFRILDLAGELRELIYEEALVHNRTKGRNANVALLLTCREIHHEARDIIYNKDSCFAMRFECKPDLIPVLFGGSGRHRQSYSTEGDDPVVSRNSTCDFKHEDQHLKKADLQLCAPALLKHMRINVQVDLLHGRAPASSVARGILRSICPQGRSIGLELAALLNSDGKAREIIFTILNSGPYRGRPDMAKKDFQALRYFHPRHDIKIHGLDDEVVSDIQASRMAWLATKTRLETEKREVEKRRQEDQERSREIEMQAAAMHRECKARMEKRDAERREAVEKLEAERREIDTVEAEKHKVE